LATVVVGGLLIGPLMLLVVVPPLRMVFLRGRDHGEGGASRRDGRSATTEAG